MQRLQRLRDVTRPLASTSHSCLALRSFAADSSGVAVITGGTGGIGGACAHRLAARGCDLVLAYGRNDVAAARAKQELESKHGVQVFIVQGDLTQETVRAQTIANLFEIVDMKLGGKVSAVVHAAGLFHDEMMNRMLTSGLDNFDVYDAYQSIYPKAFVQLAENAVPRMSDKFGRLVVITNPGCNATQTPRDSYDMPGTGKATMEHLVRLYAKRLAIRGICVNAVSPGYTDTKEWDKARLMMGKGDLEAGRKILDERLLQRSPMRRWAAPDEVAQTVDFLCGEQTGLITGAVIPVDGGLSLV